MKSISSLVFILAIVSGIFAQNYAVTNYTTSNSSIASNDILSIKVATNGDVWFATNGSGVSRLNGTTWTTFTTSQGLVGNTVKDIDIDASGNVWFATSAGLSKYNGSTFTNYTTAQGLASNDLRSVFVDVAGNIWAGTAGAGVCKYNGISWTTYNTTDGLAQNFVLATTQDSLGNLWFATANGVSKFTGSVWTTYTSSNGLIANGDEVQSAMTDRDGNVWFGSKPGFGIGGGLSMYNGSTWSTYNLSNGLASNDVRGMDCDAKNRLWFSTYLNGASQYKNGTFTTYSTSQGLISATQQCVDVAPDGYVWVGTTAGASRVATIVYQNYDLTNNTCGSSFDGEIVLFAGTISSMLYYSFDNGVTYQSANFMGGLPSGSYDVWVTDSSMFVQGPTIDVLDIPEGDAFPFDSTDICLGDSVQLNPDVSFSNFIWDPDSIVSSGTASNPFIFPSVSQWIAIDYIDSNACDINDFIYLNVIPSPVFNVDISNDSVFSVDGTFTWYQWFWYGDTIPGATNQTYTATQPGIYSVCVSNSLGCSTWSGMIHYQNTGIGETENQTHVYISNGVLYYDLPESNCFISLYATDGRLITSFSVDDQNGIASIDVRNNQVVLVHIEGCKTNCWNKMYFAK